MAEKTYVIHFKPPETSVQTVKAATAEVVDGYLVLYSEEGDITGLFHMEVVQSWSVEAIN